MSYEEDDYDDDEDDRYGVKDFLNDSRGSEQPLQFEQQVEANDDDEVLLRVIRS